jgi:hypothetical protein
VFSVRASGKRISGVYTEAWGWRPVFDDREAAIYVSDVC